MIPPQNGWRDSAKSSELFRDGKLVAQVGVNFWGNRWLWWLHTTKREGQTKTRDEAKAAVEKEVGK